MKVIIAMLIVLVIVAMVWTAIECFRKWSQNRTPWTLQEDEDLSGGRMAWFAVKPGHEPQRLTAWRWTDSNDFAADWADDLALAESKVTHMNLKGRKVLNG